MYDLRPCQSFRSCEMLPCSTWPTSLHVRSSCINHWEAALPHSPSVLAQNWNIRPAGTLKPQICILINIRSVWSEGMCADSTWCCDNWFCYHIDIRTISDSLRRVLKRRRELGWSTLCVCLCKSVCSGWTHWVLQFMLSKVGQMICPHTECEHCESLHVGVC